MSGTVNPLQAMAPAAQPGANSLAASSGPAPQAASPALISVPNGVSNIIAQKLGPEQIAQHITMLNAGLPDMAKLAHKPNVTRTDVLKATADAVGSKRITASEAIQFITSMPEDPEKLRGWLQTRYHTGLAASVALHSVGHQMVAGGQGAPQAAPGMPQPGAPQ